MLAVEAPVTLSVHDMMLAVFVGGRRQVNAIAKGFEHVLWRGANGRGEPYAAVAGRERDSWRLHIEAAGAELAVARHTGRYWLGAEPRTFGAPDVAPDLQVRLRLPESGDDLCVRAKDDPAHRFVLVHGTMPTYTIMGWITGADAMMDFYRHRTEPVFWVPPPMLHDIELLVLR